MKCITCIVLTILGIPAGCYFAYYPEKGLANIFKIKWVLPTILTFVFVSMSMPLDFELSRFFYEKKDCIGTIVGGAIDAGFFIFILCIFENILISRLLFVLWSAGRKTMNKKMNPTEMDFFLKMLFSQIVLANLVLLYFDMKKGAVTDESIYGELLLSKIYAWIITVLGTWWGIGFHAKSKIHFSLQNIIEKWRITGTIKSMFFTLISTILCICLDIRQSELSNTLLLWMESFMTSAAISIVLLSLFLYPGKCGGKVYLNHAIKKILLGNDCAKGRFFFVKYELRLVTSSHDEENHDESAQKQYILIISEDDDKNGKNLRESWLGRKEYVLQDLDKQKILYILQHISQKRHQEIATC